MENQFHKVQVFAIGSLRLDGSHHFVAFFARKDEALEYVKKHSPSMSLFDLSYSILQSDFDEKGDFFVMR